MLRNINENSTVDFFQHFTIGKALLLLLTPILTILISVHASLFGLLLIMIIDLITGIRKYLHNNQLYFNLFRVKTWIIVRSEGLRKSWIKAIEYGLGIIITAIIESIFFSGPVVDLWGNLFTVTQIVILIACAIELWSIWENLKEVNPNSRFLGVFGKIGPMVKDYFWDKLKALFKK